MMRKIKLSGEMITVPMTPPTDEWSAIHYPEISDEENDEIRTARRAGYAAMFPCFPSAQAQSDNTLKGARAYLKSIS